MNIETTESTTKMINELLVHENNNDDKNNIESFDTFIKNTNTKEQQLIQLLYNEIYKDGGCTIVVFLKDYEWYQLKNKINNLLGKQIKLIQFFEKYTSIFIINRNIVPHKVYLIHNNNNHHNYFNYQQQQQQQEDTNNSNDSTTPTCIEAKRKLLDHICYILRRRNTKIEKRRQHQLLLLQNLNQNQQQEQEQEHEQQQVQQQPTDESYVNINWLLSNCITVFHLYLRNLKIIINVKHNNDNDTTTTSTSTTNNNTTTTTGSTIEEWYYQTLYPTPDDVQIPGSKQWLQLVENEFFNFLHTNSNNNSNNNNNNELLTDTGVTNGGTTGSSNTSSSLCRLQLKQFPVVPVLPVVSKKDVSTQQSLTISQVSSKVVSFDGTNNNSTLLSYKYKVRLVEEEGEVVPVVTKNNNQKENTNTNIVSKIAIELYNVIQIDGSTTISLSLLLHRYNTFKVILGGRNLQQLIQYYPNQFNTFIDEIYVYNNETFIRNKCILQRGTSSTTTNNNKYDASSAFQNDKEISNTIISSSTKDDNNTVEWYSVGTNEGEEEYDNEEEDPNYLSKRRMDIDNDETGLYSLASGKWGNAVMTCIKQAIRVHFIKQQQQQDNTPVTKKNNIHKINYYNTQQSNHHKNNNNHIALVVDLIASVGGMTLAIARRLRMTATTTTGTPSTSAPTTSVTILNIDDKNSDSHTATTIVDHDIDDNNNDVPDIVSEQTLPQTNATGSSSVSSSCRTTKIIAVEIDPHRATLCKQNMIKYGYCSINSDDNDNQHNIEVWNMDAMDAIPKIPFTTFVQVQQQIQSNLPSDCFVIVLDPPWGGIHYRYDKKQQYMMGQWTLEDVIVKAVYEFQSQLSLSSLINPKTTNKFSSIQVQVQVPVTVLFISLRMPVFFDVDQFTTSLRDERNLVFDIEIVRKIGFQLVLVLSFTANIDL